MLRARARGGALALALAVLLLPLAAGAAPNDGSELFGRPVRADRTEVERALSAFEQVPGRAALLRLGDDIERVLHAIVRAPGRRVLARTRALAVLRHFPSLATRALLLEVIATTRRARRGLALVDLQQALPSYAAIVGTSALPLCRELLRHSDLDTRVAAAAAIVLTRHANARAILVEHRGQERSATVRAEIDRLLGELDRAARRRR